MDNSNILDDYNEIEYKEYIEPLQKLYNAKKLNLVKKELKKLKGKCLTDKEILFIRKKALLNYVEDWSSKKKKSIDRTFKFFKFIKIFVIIAIIVFFSYIIINFDYIVSTIRSFKIFF